MMTFLNNNAYISIWLELTLDFGMFFGFLRSRGIIRRIIVSWKCERYYCIAGTNQQERNAL
jgi:hypothetical protein